uniref:Uncharacterized protein n=1 Tax=Anguilla anguilla TaxID=7936 RepID=A0A0E9QJ67_ANGAN
MTINKATIAI